MTRNLFLAAAGILLAAPSFAQTVTELDTDGDGMVSYEELTAMYPDVTEGSNSMDTDAD